MFIDKPSFVGRTTEATSIFTYEDGKSWADYNHPDLPSFGEESDIVFRARDESTDQYESCLYKYSTTKDDAENNEEESQYTYIGNVSQRIPNSLWLFGYNIMTSLFKIKIRYVAMGLTLSLVFK